MFWPFKSFLQAEVLVSLNTIVVPPTPACNPVSLDREQEMQRSFSLALGHAVIIVSSKFKGQRCAFILLIYFVCVCVFVNRVFHSKGLSPGPPYLCFLVLPLLFQPANVNQKKLSVSTYPKPKTQEFAKLCEDWKKFARGKKMYHM